MKKLFFVVYITLSFITAKAQVTSNDELPAGWWQIPKSDIKIKVGGYVKFDLIHDFNPIGSPDYFDVSKIPTDSSVGETTHMNAKETRLFIDVRSPSKVGELRAYVEGDFYGTSGAFRLRHAFLEIGKHWMAGQYWSNFMDENIIPPTLDFEKPAAYAFARHALVRWKTDFKKSYVAIALEEPSASGQTPAEAGTYKNPLPDITARYRMTDKWGHVQLSGFYGMLQYIYSPDSAVNTNLYGANLSGQFNFLKKDKIIYQVVYGPGVGRYRGGLSTGINADGDIEALQEMGFTVGVLHYWNPHLSTLLVYNQGEVEYTEGQPTSDPFRVNYMAANLIWHITEQLFVGAEFLKGTRENISEATGTANRLQLSASYSFNK